MTTKFLPFIISLALFISCNDAEIPKNIETNSVIVIAVDHSGSIKQNSEDIKRQKNWLKKYLAKNLHYHTDVILFSINDYSNSATNHFLIEWQHNVEEKPDFETESDKILRETAIDAENRSQKRKIIERSIEKAFEERNQKSSKTSILELLPAVGNLQNNYTDISLVFLSDMLPESGIRNMSKFPSDKNQSESLANEDTQKLIKQFEIKENILKNVKNIDVIVPAQTNQEMMTTVPYYWQQLYSNFAFKGNVNWNSP